MQTVCSIECAKVVAEATRVKEAKKQQRRQKQADRQALEKLKKIPELLREAQIVFNRFIRLRDEGKPCICCGRMSSGDTYGGDWDAGHYRSRGAAPHLRFDEANVHAQLKQCNRYASGNVVGYRLGLIERIGLSEVERLESDNRTHKWTADELRAIKREYAEKIKQLKKLRAE